MDDTDTQATPTSQTISLNDADEDKSDTRDISPAMHDSSSASGHAPDLEVDDDVDELGEESGISYNSEEELGIDHKVSVTTQSQPPEEDQPS